MQDVCVVIPNLNGEDTLPDCLESLKAQTLPIHVIVVENASTDHSLQLLKTRYPEVEVLVQAKNTGFARGVNIGISRAMELNASFVGLLNNDAAADHQWARELVGYLQAHPDVGIATPTMTTSDKKRFDSTGEMYSVWGLPFPRDRDEVFASQQRDPEMVFGASGGASFYNTLMLREVGLFDVDFFAYYEDVDLSFRAQLTGWKVAYVPAAIVYHGIGMTSRRMKGFTTYQTMKNLPLLLWKNAPASVFWRILPRFIVAYCSFMASAAARKQLWPAIRGFFRMLSLLPRKSWERWHIQHSRRVKPDYIWGMVVHDLPPNARKLRLLFHPLKAMRNKA